MSNRIAGPSRRRWLSGLLVLSLAVNAFVVGAIATDLIRVKWSGERGSGPLRFELRWLERRLDPDAFRQVEQGVAAAEPVAVAHIGRLRELRAELAALAAAPEPNRAAIDAQLEAIRAEVAAMQTDAQSATMDALLELPAEARRPLADSMTRP